MRRSCSRSPIGPGPKFVDAWQTGEWEGAATDFTLPLWPLKAIIVFGATTTGLQFVRLALRDVLVLVTGVPQDETAPKDAPGRLAIDHRHGTWNFADRHAGHEFRRDVQSPNRYDLGRRHVADDSIPVSILRLR